MTLSILSNCGLNIFQRILLSKNYFFVIGNIFLIGSPHFNWTCRATLSESNILTEHANDMNITNATNLIAIIWFWSVDFVFWRKSRHAEKPTDNDITRESEWNAEIFVKLPFQAINESVAGILRLVHWSLFNDITYHQLVYFDQQRSFQDEAKHNWRQQLGKENIYWAWKGLISVSIQEKVQWILQRLSFKGLPIILGWHEISDCNIWSHYNL